MKSNCKVWQKIGECGVDAGLLFIGDPCYLSRNKPYGINITEEEKEGNPFRDWSKFCDQLFKHQDTNAKNLSSLQEMVLNQGIVFQTLHGDGTYSVYYYETYDGFKGVTVILDGDDDEFYEETEEDED